MSKRSRGMRRLVTVLASGTAALAAGAWLAAVQFDRDTADQVQQQDNAAVVSQGVNAERLSRWQEARGLHVLQEQARREKAEQLKLAEEERAIWQEQARRTEARMQNVLQPHFPPYGLDVVKPLVEYDMQIFHAYSDEGCVACEIRVPRKQRHKELAADTHPIIQAYRLPWPDAP